MDHFAEEMARNAKPGFFTEGNKTAMKLGAAIVVLLGLVGGVSYSYGSYLREKEEFELSQRQKSNTSVNDKLK